uniref:Uncharacterized protein n=1 Tax=Panagrolaimus sp. PS1159 TaxID=55785 RepID=A0AC35GK25_9BILA
MTMSENFDERLQQGVERMQNLGESMEETINQLRQKPELASHKDPLIEIIERLQNLYNEIDGHRKDGDGIIATLISDKTEAQSNLQEEADARTKIIDLYNSTAEDEEQAIKECEQEIRKLKETLEQGKKANKNLKEKMKTLARFGFGSSIGALACSLGGFAFRPLAVVAVGLNATTVVSNGIVYFKSEKSEMNLVEIQNQMQSQMNKKASYQNRINAAKQSVESKQRDIDQVTMKIKDFELKIQKYREAVFLTSFCKKVIFHWHQFLKDLTLSMNRLEYRFGVERKKEMVAVKDTVAYQKYVQLLNGSDADKSLKAATNICRITSMDVFDMMNRLSF